MYVCVCFSMCQYVCIRHRLAMRVGIPRFANMSKDVLFQHIQRHGDYDRLVRAETRTDRTQSSAEYHCPLQSNQRSRKRGATSHSAQTNESNSRHNRRRKTTESSANIDRNDNNNSNANKTRRSIRGTTATRNSTTTSTTTTTTIATATATTTAMRRRVKGTTTSPMATRSGVLGPNSSSSPQSQSQASANTIDPIMLEPIGQKSFTFVRPNGSIVMFNIDSLIDFLLSSGDFHDPVSRIPFSDEDLAHIDQLVRSV